MSVTILQSLLHRLRQAAGTCARIRANMEDSTARGRGFETASSRRIRLWFEILGQQAYATKEARARWLAEAKAAGAHDSLLRRLRAGLDRLDGSQSCAALAELAREDARALARDSGLDPALEREIDEGLVEFVEESSRANGVREELIEHAAERIEILARRMLRHSSAALRTNVQTGDVFVGAAMRLMRALRQVSPLDPQAFFGLVGLQIRRELIDVARRCKRVVPSSPEPVGTEPASADDPRQLESWTRFHEAIDRLASELKMVVELHWYEGLTQDEIAEVAGVDVSTVKRRWRSARKWLATELQDCADLMLDEA